MGDFSGAFFGRFRTKSGRNPKFYSFIFAKGTALDRDRGTRPAGLNRRQSRLQLTD